jgi:hypothetical protein
MKKITIEIENEDGEPVEHELPTIYEVCGRCRGEGKHTNPSIDGHGISEEEWERDWSYEEREDYMNGVYDVQCYECNGLRVVAAVDEELLKMNDPKLYKAWREWQQEEWDYQQMVASERRYGA